MRRYEPLLTLCLSISMRPAGSAGFVGPGVLVLQQQLQPRCAAESPTASRTPVDFVAESILTSMGLSQLPDPRHRQLLVHMRCTWPRRSKSPQWLQSNSTTSRATFSIPHAIYLRDVLHPNPIGLLLSSPGALGLRRPLPGLSTANLVARAATPRYPIDSSLVCVRLRQRLP